MNLGEFELLVLAAPVRLGEDGYGAAVFRELEERSGRDVSMGAVYTTLYRLEAKSLVTSQLGAPTPERGGRAKRYFAIEPAGAEALHAAVGAIGALLDGAGWAWGVT